MRKALITGITGQDGQHLTEMLLAMDYEVWGLVRGQSADDLLSFRAEFPAAKLIEGDLTDLGSLVRALEVAKPDEIYNLGALSFVGLSFRQPEATANVTGLGPLRLLEALRLVGLKDSRMYQASSSEMFGKVREVPQDERTPFHPRSPYGTAKAFAHHSCVNYRESYDMWVACGILFNHEGPRRGSEFVTRKISQSVARIALGLQDQVTLGSIDPRRDWGFAGDYVRAMWLMLQANEPEDFVIATGETHSVRDFLETALEAAGLPQDLDRFLRFDSSFVRPAEVDLLIGDSTKARKQLDWAPTVSFGELVGMMVEHDLRVTSNALKGR